MVNLREILKTFSNTQHLNRLVFYIFVPQNVSIMQQRLRNLIAEGKTKEVIDELRRLTATDTEANNNALKLSARFAQYNSQQTGRLEDPSVLYITLNQLNNDLLAFVNALEENETKDGLRHSPSVSIAESQNILRGIVLAKGMPNKPLRSVTIEVVGTKDKTFTDGEGCFAIPCTGKSWGDAVSLIVEKDNYTLLDTSSLPETVLRKDSEWRFKIVMEEVAQYNADLAKSTNDIINNQNQIAEQQKQLLLTTLAELQSAKQSTETDAQAIALQQQIYRIETERDNAVGQAREIAAKLLVFDPEHASEEAKCANALFLEGKLPEAYAAFDEEKMQERAKAAQNLLQQAVSEYMQKGKLAIANGKYDDAERLYTEGVRLDDKNVDNIETLAYFLQDQNDTLKSITYFERALSLSKTDDLVGTFCNDLGNAYSDINKMPEAEKYYLQSLDIRTRLAKNNPQQFETDLATTANNLGEYYRVNNKMSEAEKYYLQSFDIDLRLTKSNPQKFEADLATTANNLGEYYRANNRMPEAEKYYLQALDISERLAKSNPQEFELDLATTAMNLGNYYSDIIKMPEAEKYYLQALDIYARLAKSNPQQFEPDLALTAMNLGTYYSDINKMPEAEKYYLHSLDIYARLAKSNPQQFEPDLAMMAMNLGAYYKTVNNMPEVEKYDLQSLDIYARLAKSNPQQFEPELARIAMNVGNYYCDINKMAKAKKYYLQALDISEQLAKSNPQQFEPDLAFILNNFGWFYCFNKQYSKAQDLLIRTLALRQKTLINGQMHFREEYSRVVRNLEDVLNGFREEKNYPKVVEIQMALAESKDTLRGLLDNGDAEAAQAYGILSWHQLFVQDYTAAEASAQQGLVLDASQTWIRNFLAHALLFQNKDAAAKKVYDALKNTKNTEVVSYRDLLTEDFDILEQAGLDKQQLDKARQWVKE
jgi:tetratricopeptide (TPR) repeat protein